MTVELFIQIKFKRIVICENKKPSISVEGLINNRCLYYFISISFFIPTYSPAAIFAKYIPLLYNIKNKTKLHLTLFFTYPVSLKIWDDNGLLDREIKIYQRLISRYNLSITFLTYGDKTDSIIANRIDDICVIPIYEKLYNNPSIN